MADKQYLLKFNRLAAEPLLPNTNQDSAYSYFLYPEGANIDTSTLYTLSRGGLQRWLGNVSGVWGTDCGIVVPPPPPDTTPPGWNNTAPKPAKYVAGQRIDFFVPYSSITPAPGQNLTGVQMPAYPNFLSLKAEDTGVRIYGTVPAGFDQLFDITLRAYQSNNTSADKTFSFAPEIVATGTIKAVVQYNPSGTVIIRIAPTAGNNPTVQLSGPVKFSDTGVYPTSGPGSDTVLGIVFNYAKVYTGVTIQGTYTAKIVHLGQTLYGSFPVDGQAKEQVLTLTENPPGNAPNYALQVADSINEGGPIIRAVAMLNGVPDTGGTYGLTGGKNGLSINPATGDMTNPANDTINDGYQFGVTYTKNGTVLATAMCNSIDKTPYIVSILHLFDPSIQTDYFLLKHSDLGINPSDTSHVPVWRCKRAEESNWRGSFVACYNTQGQFAQYNQGYHFFMQANLSAAGVNQTNGVFEFKVSPSASDSTIIRLTANHNNNSAPDMGTEVYNVNGGSAPPDPNDRSSLQFIGIYEVSN